MSLKPGMDDPRTPILRQRLAVEDPETPAAAEDPAKPNLFDPGLVKALGRFQQRHGIKPDGAMGKDTLAELNKPVEYRIGQILANLERWRWLPRTAPADRIEVNIAAQTLERYQANKLVMFMRTVAGRKTDPTPILRSDIHSVVLNPPWNVPTSIATKELWPKQRADPSYFEKEEISVQPNGTLQQRAGPKSALGKFKFDFVNSFGVYLHDTPAQTAFDREARDVSHGCVRLEKPADLAKALLSGSQEWSSQKIDAVLQGGDTTRARLPQSVPVYLLYWTVYQDAQAQLNFRRDIYDWDARLLRLLDAGKTHA
jgi:murein L,D-transpeptidase YcbB/YkuD